MKGHIRLIGHQPTKTGLDQMIKNFTAAYPGVKVSAQYLPPGPQFSQTLLSLVNGGNAPDVMVTNPNPASDVPAPVLGKAGKLMDLSQQPFVQQIPKADRDLFSVDGKLYAESLWVTGSGMNYNATEFKKLGWQPPTTFKELLDLCGKAKAAGKNLIAFPGQVPIEAVNSMSAAFVLGQDPDWIHKRIDGKVTFASSPEWKSLYQHMLQLRDADCFQPGWAAAAQDAVEPLMASEKTLMNFSTSPDTDLAQDRPDVDIASVPFPADDAAHTRAMLGYNFGLAVSSTTKNKDAALAFIKFAATEKAAKDFGQSYGEIWVGDLKSGSLPASMASYAPFIKDHKVVPRPESEWPTSTTNADLYTVTSAILSGKSIESSLARLDKSFGK